MEVSGQHHVLAALPPGSNPGIEYLVWRAPAFEWAICKGQDDVHPCTGTKVLYRAYGP